MGLLMVYVLRRRVRASGIARSKQYSDRGGDERGIPAAGMVHGHDSIMLGAWGCGAFGIAGAGITPLFRQALGDSFRGANSQVIFAVLDWSREQRSIRLFQRAFN